MSIHFEMEGCLMWLIRDGIIPSNIVWLCEEAMRCKMYDFIEHEVVDLRATHMKPALFDGDLEFCKREMVLIVATDAIGLRKWLLMRTRVYVRMRGDRESMQTDLAMVSNCQNIDELISKIQQMKKNREAAYACEPQEGLHVSNTSTGGELGECSFNSQTETPDQMKNQNTSYLCLPFIGLRTRLIDHLIEVARYRFVIWHRDFIKYRSLHSSRIQKEFSKDGDIAEIMAWNRAANWKAEHARLREEFLTRAMLQPPQVLRLIDIQATYRRRRVVLIDYRAQEVGYTAISHTYGMDIYKVFDCPCASECFATERPRWSDVACPHCDDDASSLVRAGSEKQKKAMDDILRMCSILRTNGVKYAWHDWVCIAQHDEAEVEDSIKHMGWIYANATETVIFLHYVGNPMAPVRNSNDIKEICCRWHTRVWTLQEAALSNCRRYCVRVGRLGDCQSVEEFEEKIALWYGDESGTIEILEEDRFLEFVKEIHTELFSLCGNLAEKVVSIPDDADEDVIVECNWVWHKVYTWYMCTKELVQSLLWTCFEFPTLERVLALCSDRDSKHKGDAINSILALAEVSDFFAEKDENLEARTMEFFERHGQLGLAMAVFSINGVLEVDADKQYMTKERRHTWPPVLWRALIVISFRGIDKENVETIGFKYKVLEDGGMEVRGEMKCVKVRFNVRDQLKMNCVQEEEHADDELVLPIDELPCLDMDLTQHELCKFQASISECVMGRVRISAIERCNGQTPVLAREINDGDSFNSYLVIPCRRHWLYLIVQGNPDDYVSKVGSFDATEGFLERVRHHPKSMEKLIII